MNEKLENLVTWLTLFGLIILVLPFAILIKLLKSIPILICVCMICAAAYCMITTPEAIIACVFVMLFFGYGLTQEL